MADDAAPSTFRSRREPPRFRILEVVRIAEVTPRMRQIVLGGPDLEGFEDPGPASSVRLLLPPSDRDAIVLPTWAGNEFVLPDGSRAPIRTFTPRRFDAARLELTIEVVLHEGGVASEWARSAATGVVTAVSGPGRGYQVEHDVGSYLLAGDETALPAIAQLLETISPETSVDVHVEIADPSARQDLPAHPRSQVSWHLARPGAAPGSAFVAAIEGLDEIGEAVWVAGEAAAAQRVRVHLAEMRGRPRSTATVRGYWKTGSSGT